MSFKVGSACASYWKPKFSNFMIGSFTNHVLLFRFAWKKGQRASHPSWCFSLIFLFQRSLFRPGRCVRKAQDRTYNRGRQNISHTAHCSLQENLFHRLVVDQNVQSRRDQSPGNQMRNNLDHVKDHGAFDTEFALGQINLIAYESHRQSEKRGTRNPAPPYAPAACQVA